MPPISTSARRSGPRPRNSTLLAGLFLVHAIASSSPAAAQLVTIFEHLGSTDPSTEGWLGSGGSPVPDDGGTGFDSWSTTDDTAIAASEAYLQTVPTETLEQGNQFGWTLSARLRVVERPEEPNPDVADGSPALLYRDGARTWQIHFGASNITFLTSVATPSGNVLSETPIAVPGGTTAYRLYELKYDPESQTAALSIDGVAAASGLVGAPFGVGFPIPESVYWGSASTDGIGQGHFNLVRFAVEAPPVPAVAPAGWVVLTGLLVALGYRRLARTA